MKAAARAKGPRGKVAWLDSFFEFLSDSFRPILGALLGASLFITFMALMSTLGVIPNWADPREASALSPTWQFVNLCWQSVFVFLPLMVAYNASKKLGADPWVGFAIMAVVMLPGASHAGCSPRGLPPRSSSPCWRWRNGCTVRSASTTGGTPRTRRSATSS